MIDRWNFKTRSFYLVFGILALCAGSAASCGGSTTTEGGEGGSTSTSSGGEDCGMSLCGCWSDMMMSFEATLQNPQTMEPLSGVELYCGGETMPIAISDAMGKISFTIATKQSPGCGFERCNNMRLHAPLGPFVDYEGTYFSMNGETIFMQYPPD